MLYKKVNDVGLSVFYISPPSLKATEKVKDWYLLKSQRQTYRWVSSTRVLKGKQYYNDSDLHELSATCSHEEKRAKV